MLHPDTKLLGYIRSLVINLWLLDSMERLALFQIAERLQLQAIENLVLLYSPSESPVTVDQDILSKLLSNPIVRLTIFGGKDFPVHALSKLPHLKTLRLYKGMTFSYEEGSVDAMAKKTMPWTLKYLEASGTSFSNMGAPMMSLYPTSLSSSLVALKLAIRDLPSHQCAWSIIHGSHQTLEVLTLEYARNVKVSSLCTDNAAATTSKRCLPSCPQLLYFKLLVSACRNDALGVLETNVSIPSVLSLFISTIIGISRQPSIKLIDITFFWTAFITRSHQYSFDDKIIDSKQQSWALIDDRVSDRAQFPALQAIRILPFPETRYLGIDDGSVNLNKAYLAQGSLAHQAREEMLATLPRIAGSAMLFDVGLDVPLSGKIKTISVVPSGCWEPPQSLWE